MDRFNLEYFENKPVYQYPNTVFGFNFFPINPNPGEEKFDQNNDAATTTCHTNDFVLHWIFSIHWKCTWVKKRKKKLK